MGGLSLSPSFTARREEPLNLMIGRMAERGRGRAGRTLFCWGFWSLAAPQNHLGDFLQSQRPGPSPETPGLEVQGVALAFWFLENKPPRTCDEHQVKNDRVVRSDMRCYQTASCNHSKAANTCDWDSLSF